MKKELTWEDFEPMGIVRNEDVKVGEIYGDMEELEQISTFGIVEAIDSISIYFKHIGGFNSYSKNKGETYTFFSGPNGDTWLHVKRKQQ